MVENELERPSCCRRYRAAGIEESRDIAGRQYFELAELIASYIDGDLTELSVGKNERTTDFGPQAKQIDGDTQYRNA